MYRFEPDRLSLMDIQGPRCLGNRLLHCYMSFSGLRPLEVEKSLPQTCSLPFPVSSK